MIFPVKESSSSKKVIPLSPCSSYEIKIEAEAYTPSSIRTRTVVEMIRCATVESGRIVASVNNWFRNVGFKGITKWWSLSYRW